MPHQIGFGQYGSNARRTINQQAGRRKQCRRTALERFAPLASIAQTTMRFSSAHNANLPGHEFVIAQSQLFAFAFFTRRGLQ